MSSKATRDTSGKARRKSDGKAARGGADCICCPACFYPATECCSGQVFGVVPCGEYVGANLFMVTEGELAGYLSCFTIDTTSPLADPGDEPLLKPETNVFGTNGGSCEDCIECGGPCACCYGDGDIGQLTWSITPSYQPTYDEGTCACLEENLNGFEVCIYDSTDHPTRCGGGLSPCPFVFIGSNACFEPSGCDFGYEIGTCCGEPVQDFTWAFGSEDAGNCITYKAPQPPHLHEIGQCGEHGQVEAWAFIVSGHCFDSTSLPPGCREGTPGPGGECTDLP